MYLTTATAILSNTALDPHTHESLLDGCGLERTLEALPIFVVMLPLDAEVATQASDDVCIHLSAITNFTHGSLPVARSASAGRLHCVLSCLLMSTLQSCYAGGAIPHVSLH
jgi:hypothetical protein